MFPPISSQMISKAIRLPLSRKLIKVLLLIDTSACGVVLLFICKALFDAQQEASSVTKYSAVKDPPYCMNNSHLFFNEFGIGQDHPAFGLHVCFSKSLT
jgi:hypothetical protein